MSQQVIVEYRTKNTETLSVPDFWYSGDSNPDAYESIEDALANSDVVRDWQSGNTGDLTVVRLHDLSTGRFTYVPPKK